MSISGAGFLSFGRRLGWLLLASTLVAAVGSAFAAERVISPGTDVFECGNIDPGDVLTLPSGTRGELTIRNCKATAANPIVVRNDPRGNGPTIIRRSGGSSGGFLFSCNTCIGVVIDGSYKWQGAPSGKTYGIQITMTGGGAPTSFMKIGGLSRFVTVRNVEIDGKWPAIAKSGAGVRLNDLQIRRSAYPGLWREGILFEDNYIHDVANEGMYIGANYSDGDLPLRDIEIRNNRVEDIGWEAINTKSMWVGDNRIHHNVVRRAGKNGTSSKPTQYSGINNASGTVKIYNNWIERTGQNGIVQWTSRGPSKAEGKGPFDTYIWNNVIVDAGALYRTYMNGANGINIGAKDGLEEPNAYVYSNTIVNARQSGIRASGNVGGGFIRDNIVAGAAEAPISASSVVQQANNRVGSVDQMGFVDSSTKNFRLKSDSAARNQGTNQYPDTDYDDVVRPQDGTPDQGAFEYEQGGAVASKPNAPSSLVVN